MGVFMILKVEINNRAYYLTATETAFAEVVPVFSAVAL
tara:strand:- start:180 stop:293 length:114 start_codon:yes stop_codon:yes gene_type:complete